MSVLKVSNLSKSFGGLQAVAGLDFIVNSGEILALIGPNGSGKTTTINVLTQVLAPTTGEVMLDEHRLSAMKASQIVRCGLVRTFQNLRLFNGHSVLDNVRVSQTIHCHTLASRLNALQWGHERVLRREAEELVERFGLAKRMHVPAGALSYGEKKRLEMARALATRPKFILLDEPAAGMNTMEVNWLQAAIREVQASGVGILLVEHHMNLVMNISDRILVLNFGKKIADGPPELIARDAAVIESYLGKAH